jgi:acetyl-CoA synthetase
MESILTQHSAILEAATIGVPDNVKGEVPVSFVVMNKTDTNILFSEELSSELLAFVEQRLGKGLRPKAIHVIEGLPKTRNGKVVRRVIRAAYLDLDLGDISTLENPEVLTSIRLFNENRCDSKLLTAE